MTRLRIKGLNKKWVADITVSDDKLKQIGNIPSGKIAMMTIPPNLTGKDSDVVYIKPYYRRRKNGEMVIFALEVPINE